MVLSRRELAQLKRIDPESTKITYPSSYDLYRRRPVEFADFTMAEYFENCEYPKNRKKVQNFILDLDGKKVVRLATPRPVKFVLANSQNAPQTAIMFLMLFFPWRDYKDLMSTEDYNNPDASRNITYRFVESNTPEFYRQNVHLNEVLKQRMENTISFKYITYYKKVLFKSNANLFEKFKAVSDNIKTSAKYVRLTDELC